MVIVEITAPNPEKRNRTPPPIPTVIIAGAQKGVSLFYNNWFLKGEWSLRRVLILLLFPVSSF